MPLDLSRTIQDKRLHAMIEMGRSLTGAGCLDDCLAMIVDLTSQMLSSDRSSIFLYDPSTNELVSRIAKGLDQSQEIRFPATKGLAGFVATTRETLNVPDAYEDERFNRQTDKVTGYRTRSVLAAPLIGRGDKVIGVIQVLNRDDGASFDAKDEHLLKGICGQCAVAVENARMIEEIDALLEAFIEASSQAIDQRDPATAGHSRRVTQMSLNLARAVHYCETPPYRAVQYTRSRIRQLRYAGLLHDFGKIGVREAVLCKVDKLHPRGFELVSERLRLFFEKQKNALLLRKLKDGEARPGETETQLAELSEQCEETVDFIRTMNASGGMVDGGPDRLDSLQSQALLNGEEVQALNIRRGNLTDEEWGEMRSHVTKSYQVLKKIPWPEDLGDVPEIAHGHHEKLNGSGYPQGIGSDEIHFDSKIMCVADIYDALTCSDRPYKKAMPHERAMSILREEADRGALVPELVELFEKAECNNITGTGDTTISIFNDEI